MLSNENESPQEAEQLISEISEKIVGRGYSSIGIFLLDISRPFSSLGYNLSVSLSNFITMIIGKSAYQKMIRLIESPENIEKLIKAIEARELSKSVK